MHCKICLTFAVSLINLCNFSFCSSLMKLCKSHLLEQKPIEIDTTEEPSQKTNKSESPVLSCLLNVLKILSNITYNICKYI